MNKLVSDSAIESLNNCTNGKYSLEDFAMKATIFAKEGMFTSRINWLTVYLIVAARDPP